MVLCTAEMENHRLNSYLQQTKMSNTLEFCPKLGTQIYLPCQQKYLIND